MDYRYVTALHDYDGPRLTTSQRLVICVLAAMSQKRGFAWPTVATLSLITGLASSSVRSVTAELEGLGLLEKRRQRRGRAGNLYRLTGVFDDGGGDLEDLPL